MGAFDTLEKVANVVDDGLSKVKTVKNAASTVKGTIIGKGSISRLTKDSVFQFPLFMEADIDSDKQYPIAKNIEKNYATLIMIGIVNEGIIDKNKYNNIGEFLKTFHTNNAIGVESYTIASESYVSKDDEIALDSEISEMVDTGSINDMYKPFTRTISKIKRSLEVANEAATAKANEKKYFKVPAYTNKDGEKIAQKEKDGDVKYNYILAPNNQAKYNNMAKKYGEAKSMGEWNGGTPVRSNAKASMIKDDTKTSAMTPTVLQLNINSTKDGAVWSQDLMIGIRADLKLVPRTMMVESISDAYKDASMNTFIFKMMGAINNLKSRPWYDTILGISAARKKVIASNNTQFINQLANAKRKATSKKLIPNATIIITAEDAMDIKIKTGIDPHNASHAQKFIEKYFLVAFGIYDDTLATLHMIYDGETEYTAYPMRQLLADAKRDIVYTADKT